MWQTGKSEVIVPVKDLSAGPAMASVPVRRFSWRTGQRHRPGLECLVTTGGQHGFEGLAERWLLLVLGLCRRVGRGVVPAVPSAVLLLVGQGLARSGLPRARSGASWPVDVRPGGLISEEEEVRFATTAQVAAAACRRYTVVAGRSGQVPAGIDALSVRRRPMTDPLRLERQLPAAVGRRPWRLVRRGDQAHDPAVARTHPVHRLRHRRTTVDLALPSGDATWVCPAGRCDG